MKKKNQHDVLHLLEQFQKKVLTNKPNYEQMIVDVRMMQFKIKPLKGDLSQINFLDKDFVEIVWSLGKLEEFFHLQYPKLPKKFQETFFNYFDTLQRKFQDDLNRLNLKGEQKKEPPSPLEMEIFKERIKKKVN